MTPLDDELRTLLHRRADAVAPATDPLRGVQTRARRLRRRRSAGAALASAAAVVAVAVAVPTGLSAFRAADAPAPGFLGSSGTSAPASPMVSDLLGWRLQGDAAVAERMLPFVLRALEARGGPTTSGAALYARADGTSDVLIAQVRSGSMAARTVVAVAGQDSTEIYYDAPTPAGTVQISAVVPAATGSGTALAIISDPTVPTRQSVTADGAVLLAGVPGTAGEVALPDGTVPQRLTVTLTADATGDVLYTGRVIYDGTPAGEPAPSGSLPPAPSAGPAAGPATRACTAAQVTVTLGTVEGAAGSTYTTLVFRNTGPAACTLDGHPGVSYVDSAGTQVGGTALRAGTPTTVVLAPGGASAGAGDTAGAVLQQASTASFPADACRPAPVAGIRVYPPDRTESVVLPVAGTACSSPDTGRPTVTAVTAGRG